MFHSNQNITDDKVGAVRKVGQQFPLEGVDKFYCRWSNMIGVIVMQTKNIYLDFSLSS